MAGDKPDKNAKDKENGSAGESDIGAKTRLNPVLDKILAESTTTFHNLSKTPGTTAKQAHPGHKASHNEQELLTLAHDLSQGQCSDI